jgi:ectoine hydroxylase-related dioxygenase (phytanoyl-CoA dioxygenase family)
MPVANKYKMLQQPDQKNYQKNSIQQMDLQQPFVIFFNSGKVV